MSVQHRSRSEHTAEFSIGSHARTIDLNSDVGESFGSWFIPDESVLGTVSSVNIACGFHAGDPLVIRRTVQAAVETDTVVGAHVGYRDLPGFGRRFMDYEPAQLQAEVLYQIAALDGIASALGTRVRYVKPHGALYHALVDHPEQSAAVVEAVAEYNDELALLLLPGSLAVSFAEEKGLRVVREAFADRAYRPDGGLLSRREAGAVITDPALAAEAMVQLATTGSITAVDGSVIPMEAESICLHGDTPGAKETADLVRGRLEAAGVAVRSFS